MSRQSPASEWVSESEWASTRRRAAFLPADALHQHRRRYNHPSVDARHERAQQSSYPLSTSSSQYLSTSALVSKSSQALRACVVPAASLPARVPVSQTHCSACVCRLPCRMCGQQRPRPRPSSLRGARPGAHPMAHPLTERGECSEKIDDIAMENACHRPGCRPAWVSSRCPSR